MAFKIVLAVALLAVAASAVPVHQLHQSEAPAHYEFSYAVNDEHTGDIKSQQESRQGDAVHGRYELIDSDGFKRIVEYSADEHTGFVATVHREPTHIKIPVPAPRQHVQYSHAPAHYSAPVQHISYAAPATVAPVHYVQPTAAVHQVLKHTTTTTTTTTPAPVVHQYVQHQQPAYVQQHYAPATAAPAPVHYQPQYQYQQVASHQVNHEPSHVTFNAPGVNYNF